MASHPGFRIRNWSRYQHYKDRNPPWIKLHVEILSSEDWVSLDDASRLLAIVCMVIASKNDGIVPNHPSYIQRVAYLKRVPNLKPLISCGFLENLLADASESKQLHTNVRPETETETETETESISRVPRSKQINKNPLNGHQEDFIRFYVTFPKHVEKARAQREYAKALTKTDPGTLLAGAHRYAADRRGQDVKYTQNPATWLKNERWQDETNKTIVDPQKAAEAKDRADKMLGRGAYAV